jgi:hypothetical protein
MLTFIFSYFLIYFERYQNVTRIQKVLRYNIHNFLNLLFVLFQKSMLLLLLALYKNGRFYLKYNVNVPLKVDIS